MAQVYALMHNGKGDFMIFKKNLLGYFFHNSMGSGVILPKGTKLNGANNWAIPGGKLEVPNPIQGALNELLEETGVALEASQAAPAIFNGNGFYGVYFNLDAEFETLFSFAESCIDLGNQAAAAVQAGKYTAIQYDQLMADFQGCPADNELGKVEAWNFRKHIEDINRIGHNPATNWYYEILANLALEIYGVIVTDEEGLMVGLGTQLTYPAGPAISEFSGDLIRLQTQGVYTIHTKTDTIRGLNFKSITDDTAYFQEQS